MFHYQNATPDSLQAYKHNMQQKIFIANGHSMPVMLIIIF